VFTCAKCQQETYVQYGKSALCVACALGKPPAPVFADWDTQTANQAIGTGVLAGRRFWVSFSACSSWTSRLGLRTPSIYRAEQSARIGFGAL
jgi:hypothetical protein